MPFTSVPFVQAMGGGWCPWWEASYCSVPWVAWECGVPQCWACSGRPGLGGTSDLQWPHACPFCGGWHSIDGGRPGEPIGDPLLWLNYMTYLQCYWEAMFYIYLLGRREEVMKHYKFCLSCNDYMQWQRQRPVCILPKQQLSVWQAVLCLTLSSLKCVCV